jgi:hypothetical protein
MNDDDIMAAQIMAALRGAKDSLTDVRMDASADSIVARAGRRRLHRGLSVAGAGALALGVGLGVVVSGGGGVTPVSSDKSVHVNLAAWSVNTTSDGLVDVTVRELTHPAAMRQALAQAGVPAYVSFDKFCQPKSGHGLPQINAVLGHSFSGHAVLMTIDPAAMPAGSELVIGMVHAWPGTVTSFSLVKDGPLTCRPADEDMRPPVGNTPTAPAPTSSDTPIPSPTPSS